MSNPGNPAEAPLATWGSGEQPSKARLRSGVVYREAGPWSPAVLALLRHLERAGFTGAPRVVGSGFAPDGREMVSYLPGTSPHPQAWDDDAAAGVGELLRGLHDATTTFAPPPQAQWKPWFGRGLPGTWPVFGHCDTGPWNVVALAGRPVALIDFEYAGPVDAIWDLAQTAWLNAQLHDDDVAELHRLPSLAERARQLRLILDGYRLPAGDRRGFVDKMITVAVHSARAEAVEAGVTPGTTAGTTSTGYPFAWGITWRARGASWMLTHRDQLQQAIT